MDEITADYRIIRDDTKDIEWFAIHEVYYHNGKPIDHSVAPIGVFGDMNDVVNGISEMGSAVQKPVLNISDFPPMDNYRRGEWLQTKDARIVRKW